MYVPTNAQHTNNSENIAFAPENLFLKKPLSEYRVVLVSVSGDINTVELIEQVLRLGKSSHSKICLLLGPTSPFSSLTFRTLPVGWVASVERVRNIGENIEIIAPHSLLDISLFVDKHSKDESRPTIFVGDFLDSLILANRGGDSSLVFSLFENLVSRARSDGQTFVLIVSEQLHADRDMQMFRRFADVIIECRECDKDGRAVFETRGINFADRIQTPWIPGRRLIETPNGIGRAVDTRLRQDVM